METGYWNDETRVVYFACCWCFLPGLVRREKDWPSVTRLVRFSPQNAKNDLLFRFFSPKRKAGKYSSNKLSLQNRLWLIVNHWKMAATQKHRPRGHRPHTSTTLLDPDHSLWPGSGRLNDHWLNEILQSAPADCSVFSVQCSVFSVQYWNCNELSRRSAAAELTTNTSHSNNYNYIFNTFGSNN